MSIDWWTLALQTINFLVVVWLLNRFLYRPVRRIVDSREAAGRAAEETATRKAEEAEAARLDFEARRDALADEARRREAELHAAAAAEREAMLDTAREEAAGIVSKAREAAERARDAALKDLKSAVADLAGSLAVKAIGDSAADPIGAVDAVAAHLAALPDNDLEDLRRDLAGDSAAVAVVTAAEAGEDARARWRAALQDLMGEDVRLVFETQAEILGGAELRFPHAVLHFSVAERLRQALRALED